MDQLPVPDLEPETNCASNDGDPVDETPVCELSVRMDRKERTGEWRMTFCAETDAPNGMILELSHAMRSVGSRRVVALQGKIGAGPVPAERSPRPSSQLKVAESRSCSKATGALRFHEKSGRNAVLSEDRMTVARRDPEKEYGHCCVLSHRPLANNEMFHVKIVETVSVWTFSMGIGVTNVPLSELDLPQWMGEIRTRSGTWLMYNSDVFLNGETSFSHYGRSLEHLQVGDLVGVMRKDNGSLHFYLNGIDMGPAAVNVPFGVYGFVDVTNNVVKATIVK